MKVMHITEKLRSAKLNQLRALVVEDDEDNLRMLEKMLERYNFNVVGVTSSEEFEEHHLKRFDLFILDVMLPGKSGFDICKEVRASNATAPIIMATARSAEEDITKGYECGADDYLIKPIRMNDLRERINIHLKGRGKSRRPGHPSFNVGNWQIEPESLVAIHAKTGEVEHLSDREFDILSLFAQNAGRITSRRLLLQQVWGFPDPKRVATRTIDMHIAKLRKKIGDASSLIKTIRGHGYVYDGDKVVLEVEGEPGDNNFAQSEEAPRAATG